MERPVKVFAVTCGVLAAAFVLAMLVFEMTRDNWEIRHGLKLNETLAEAAEIAKIDELKAFNIYDGIVTEAARHKITLTEVQQYVEKAAVGRGRLEARAKAIARQRAEEKERQEAARRAAIEAAKRAELEREERRARLERRKLAINEKALKYKNASPQARAALNALKRIEARTEVGVNYSNYSQVVGEQYAEIKIFLESPEAQGMPLFSSRVAEAVANYKVAMDAWGLKIKYPRASSAKQDAEIQRAWSDASKAIKKVEEVLLNPEKELEALPEFNQ